MLIEATGQHRGPGFGLPAGVYARQSWRPPALRAVESVLSGISRRNEPLDRRRASLTAWYEQLARRGQPFIGWQPLTTGEFGGDSTQLPDGSVQSGDRTARIEPQMISTKDRTPEANVSHSAVRPVAQDQRPATHSQRLPAEPQTPQRPFLLLRSISGPMHTAAKSMPPSEAGHAPDPSGTPERPIEEAVQPVAPPEREAPYPVVPPPAAEDRRLAAEDGRLAVEDGRLAVEDGRLAAEDRAARCGRRAARCRRRAACCRGLEASNADGCCAATAWGTVFRASCDETCHPSTDNDRNGHDATKRLGTNPFQHQRILARYGRNERFAGSRTPPDGRPTCVSTTSRLKCVLFSTSGSARWFSC